ncbi:MAG TPA: hypothetical protein VFC30_04340 [Solirubrobacteraceae bacterium]|nr:hypothetical protein [Solirubrobacteraceae bacterium]
MAVKDVEIGKEVREVEIIPFKNPITQPIEVEPAHEPAVPEPVRVPAREPVPA